MHPILGNLRRLGLYLLGWVPLVALIVYLLKVVGGLGWVESAALGAPLSFLYALACLSSWYTCRTTTLNRAVALEPALAHLTAAAVVSGLWVLAARALAAGLAQFPAFAGLNGRAAKATGLIFGLGVLLYLLGVVMHYALLAVEASREAQEREAQAQVLAREAELRALKAQVNPHFIFNSLHSISALTGSDPAKAREMCILLGDFLRRTLGLGEKSMIALQEEIALIDCFLRVEKVRFGTRLTFEEQVNADVLGQPVPPLVLQPLVENAVAHGVSNLPEGGWIRLRAAKDQQSLSIVVENRFDPEALPSRRNGMGLENVRQRLEACYGNGAGLVVTTEGDCFRVSLTLPLEKRERGA
ncbi:MAG TPA: histidine kinase [Terriglobia bacterium]|nr:histidine kinase [Terriglobia bacterium]